MDYKKIKKESRDKSEELFIQHNITDIRTKRLVNDYFYHKIYTRELNKSINFVSDIDWWNLYL